MTVEEIEAIVGGYHGDSFRILGPHAVRKKSGQPRWEVRAFLPQAESAEVVAGEQPLRHGEAPRAGLLLRGLERRAAPLPHPRAAVGRPRGRDRRPLPLRPADLRFRPLPAHRRHALRGLARARRAHRRQSTASPACASPCGRRMRKTSRVAGEFNDWDVRRHPMRRRNGGIWEIFIPGLGEGASYKYNVRSRFAGYQQLKADPYAFYCETPPKSASVVWDIDKYEWQRRGVDGSARQDRAAEVARLGLRGAPGIVDARPAWASR